MNKFLRKAFSKNPDPKTKGGVLVKGGVLDNEMVWYFWVKAARLALLHFKTAYVKKSFSVISQFFTYMQMRVKQFPQDFHSTLASKALPAQFLSDFCCNSLRSVPSYSSYPHSQAWNLHLRAVDTIFIYYIQFSTSFYQ